MNKYGLPLNTPSVQTIVPAMTKDGKMIGFYPITQTTFTGTETSLTTSDTVVVPLSTVTVDANEKMRTVQQYVAAVWDVGLPVKYQPWASADLIDPNEGGYSWWSLPTQGWMHHFDKGLMINAVQSNLKIGVYSPVPSVPPSGTNASQSWSSSVLYTSLLGDCSFFDFNWMTVFNTKNNNGPDPLRISVLSNPAPHAPATSTQMKATVVGVPATNASGVVYDTIRITKLADVTPGSYAFVFRVTDTSNQTTDVTFTMTVL